MRRIGVREARVQICDTEHGRLLAHYTPFRFNILAYSYMPPSPLPLPLLVHSVFGIAFLRYSVVVVIVDVGIFNFVSHAFMETYLTSAHQSSKWKGKKKRRKRTTRIRHSKEQRRWVNTTACTQRTEMESESRARNINILELKHQNAHTALARTHTHTHTQMATKG